MDTFRHGDLTLAYVDLAPERGEGEPILLIHGFASNHSVNWVGTLWTRALLAAGRRVIALDNRGHGASDKPYDPAFYHTALMAEDARALLDHVGVERADVMGYSMGARITAFLALRHPDRVRAAILGGLGIHLVQGVGLPVRIAEAMEAQSLAALSDPTERMFRAFAEQTGSDLRALAACIRGSRQELSRGEVAGMTPPLLICVGTKDAIAGDPHALAALVPGARAFDIPGRDHNLAVGDKAYKAAVLAFLDGAALSAPEPIRFVGVEGNGLVGSRFAGEGARPPVLLLHGGGQTRRSFEGAAKAIARSGWTAVTLDQRGHGESDRSPTQAYQFSDFASDIRLVATEISTWGGAPVLVGASLGGMASLLALADGAPAAALVLVDVTPQLDPGGVAAIHGFMTEHSVDGFARLEDAADAIAAYLPHRPRPRSLAGLEKNLRRREDGRWVWRWDPAFMTGPRSIGSGREETVARAEAAVAHLSAPTLLVRGRSSELVTEEAAQAFLAAAPNAEYADIAGARHMVAGDSNDAFTDAILSFLRRRVSGALPA